MPCFFFFYIGQWSNKTCLALSKVASIWKKTHLLLQERWSARPRSGLQSRWQDINPNAQPEDLVSLTYKCAACHKMFETKGGLQKHIFLSHKKDAVKAYQCDQCDKSYTVSCNLRRHQKEDHLGIYKHVCMMCKKGFTNLGEYKGHLVKHGATKEFKCSMCEKSFTYKRQLKIHLGKVHGIQEFYQWNFSGIMRSYLLKTRLLKPMVLKDITETARGETGNSVEKT